jgi:plasmid maintenance system antidote protein VapI
MRLNQIEIAELLRVSQATVSYWMNGKRRITWAMAKKLSDHFGRTPSWWMEAPPDRIKRVLRGSRKDGSNGNGGPNEQQQRAA